jgi:ribonuclease P protein component
VFRDGTRFEGRHVQIIAAPAALPLGRFGLVVGRKALSRATERNRFKRLVREAFRASREAVARLDVVVRLKPPLRRADVDAAAREAAGLLVRAAATLAAPPAP